jgi:hypothetical protein
MDNNNKNKDKLKKDKNKDKLKKDKNKDKPKKKGGGIFNLCKLPTDVLKIIEDKALTTNQQTKFKTQQKSLAWSRLDHPDNLYKFQKHLHSRAAAKNISLFSSPAEMKQFKIDKNKKRYTRRYMAAFKPENRLLKELYRIYPDKLPQTSHGNVDVDKIIEETQENDIFIRMLDLGNIDSSDDHEITNMYMIFLKDHRTEISHYYNAVAYTKAVMNSDRFHMEFMRREYEKYFKPLEETSAQSLFPFVAASKR